MGLPTAGKRLPTGLSASCPSQRRRRRASFSNPRPGPWSPDSRVEQLLAKDLESSFGNGGTDRMSPDSPVAHCAAPTLYRKSTKALGNPNASSAWCAAVAISSPTVTSSRRRGGGGQKHPPCRPLAMTTVVGRGRFDLLKGRGKGGSRLREGVEGAEGARDLG
jgi:hypothetical protein